MIRLNERLLLKTIRIVEQTSRTSGYRDKSFSACISLSRLKWVSVIWTSDFKLDFIYWILTVLKSVLGFKILGPMSQWISVTNKSYRNCHMSLLKLSRLQLCRLQLSWLQLSRLQLRCNWLQNCLLSWLNLCWLQWLLYCRLYYWWNLLNLWYCHMRLAHRSFCHVQWRACLRNIRNHLCWWVLI